MLAMYGAWAASASLRDQSVCRRDRASSRCCSSFGLLVYRFIVDRTLDKPHLVVVFATMALVDLHAERGADPVQRRPPRRSAAVRRQDVGRCRHLRANRTRCSASLIALLVTAFLMWGLRATYVGKAVRATVQDRRSRGADGHSGAASLPDHFRFGLGPGRARRLHHAAAVLSVPDGRTELRPHRLRGRRSGRNGKRRGCAPRRHPHRHYPEPQRPILSHRPTDRCSIFSCSFS